MKPRNYLAAKAIVAILSDLIPAAHRVLPQASRVAPVVITSSTNNIDLPFKLSGSTILNAFSTFFILSVRDFLVCVVVY